MMLQRIKQKKLICMATMWLLFSCVFSAYADNSNFRPLVNFQGCLPGASPSFDNNDNKVKDWLICMMLHCSIEAKAPPTPLTNMELKADNWLRDVRFNGVSTGISVWWSSTTGYHSFSDVRPGDQFTFTVQNRGGYNKGNPGGLFGRWYWRGRWFQVSGSTVSGSYDGYPVQTHYRATRLGASGRTVYYGAWVNRSVPVLCEVFQTCNQRWIWPIDRDVHMTWTAPNLPAPSPPRLTHSECRWYQRLKDAAEVGFDVNLMGTVFQDLKNFIAIQRMEVQRDLIISELIPSPQLQQTKFAGYKAKRTKNDAKRATLQGVWQLFIWDMFNVRNYTASSYLYEHYNNYCSYFDAKFSKSTSYCETPKTPLPYDILAETLVSNDTLPKKGIEALYKSSGDNGLFYYNVNQDSDEDKSEELEKRFPEEDISQIATYENINRQEAALTYIRNLTSAVPLARLEDSKLFDDKGTFTFNKKEGIPYLKKKFDLISTLSLVRDNFLMMYASRLPRADINTLAINKDGKLYRSSFINNEAVQSSYLGLLAYESSRRFEDPNWHKQMASMPLEAMLREIANMYALQSAIKFKTMMHVERIEALIAISNSFTASLEKGAAKASMEADNAIP